MANTTAKNRSTNTSKNKTKTDAVTTEIKTPAVESAPVEKKETPKRKSTPSIEGNVYIAIKSNVFGQLIYVNKKTGDRTVWYEYGDIQDLTLDDLRAMRGSQRSFFENNWIFVDHIVDDGYDDVTSEDVYKILQVLQYYSNILQPKDLNEIFRWSVDEIKQKVPMIAKGAQTNLIVAANTAIEVGALDSLAKIKALEESLGCELTRPE